MSDAVAERTEARAEAFRAQERVRELESEHARVCREHAILTQESGREGRELQRLEALALWLIEDFGHKEGWEDCLSACIPCRAEAALGRESTHPKTEME